MRNNEMYINKKIYFPIHLDSGNRGCEAIALGCKKILDLNAENYIGLCQSISTERSFKLDQEFTLIPEKNFQNKKILWFLYRVIMKIIPFENNKKRLSYHIFFKSFLKKIDSLTLFTGGDMFCYGNNQMIYMNNYLAKRKIPTILFGCSIGKEDLTPEKIDTLKKFSAITVRETLTESILKNIGLTNVFYYPDPAFILSAKEVELPKIFEQEKDVVGINLSNFVGKDVGQDTILWKNMEGLINTILFETDYNILLIPHVFWDGQDDRVICGNIYSHYKQTKRIFLCETENLRYTEIRYIISKCRFFVGARTHSIISAYSMQVPALALGYSVKSIGIAIDIGLSKELVIDTTKVEDGDEFAIGFRTLINKEQEIRQIYSEMPNYIKKAYEAKKIVDQLYMENNL